MTDLLVHPAARLTAMAGVMAGRLGDLLEASLGSDSSPLADGRTFLAAEYAAACRALPAGPGPAGFHVPPPPGETPGPLDRVVRRLALDEIDIELLVLAGLAEEHEAYASILRGLHPRRDPWPTCGLAAQLLYPRLERWELRARLTDGVAARAGAFGLDGDGSFWERSLRMPDGFWATLQGTEGRLAGVDALPETATPFGLEEWLAEDPVRRAVLAIRRDLPARLLVTGDSADAVRWRAQLLVQAAGRRPYTVRLPAAANAESRRRIGIEAIARDAVPILQLAETEPGSSPVASGFDEHPGTVIWCARPTGFELHTTRPVLVVPATPVALAARRRLWQGVLPELAEDAAALAARYPLDPARIETLAQDLNLLRTLEGRAVTGHDLTHTLRDRAVLGLSPGLSLIRPRAAWADLVLPERRMTQLRGAVDRLSHQGTVLDEWGFLGGRLGARGVRLLFSGPPGTGKTLAAEIMANALEVDLLVVDLSRVVSKWIGDTEKNLAAVFDNAERTPAVLFFDEADALFGKRTEVVDAHDRYANLETAYLLQRLERFDGLAILATNLKQNVDGAFLRRLDFVVEFGEPDCEQRQRLWRTHVPAGAPVAPDVNFYELASAYPVVGGFIRNASLMAAYLAAADGRQITRRHLVRAIQQEYEKSGRAFPGAPVGLTL